MKHENSNSLDFNIIPPPPKFNTGIKSIYIAMVSKNNL